VSKQHKILIATLCFLAMLVLYNVWFFASKKRARPAVPPRVTTPQLAMAGAVAETESRYVSFPSLSGEFGRDPFLLPAEAEAQAPWYELTRDDEDVDENPDALEDLERYSLRGILFDRTAPMAIIDTELCRPGTPVGDQFTVREILPNAVILTDGRQLYRMTLEGVEPVLRVSEDD